MTTETGFGYSKAIGENARSHAVPLMGFDSVLARRLHVVGMALLLRKRTQILRVCLGKLEEFKVRVWLKSSETCKMKFTRAESCRISLCIHLHAQKQPAVPRCKEPRKFTTSSRNKSTACQNQSTPQIRYPT